MHTCEAIPLVYGPSYLNAELLWPGREVVGWNPLRRAFEVAGYCPHIVDDTPWHDPEIDFIELEEKMIDIALELTDPGDTIVVAGSSICGLLGAYAVNHMDAMPIEERRDARLLGLSVSSLFQTFAQICLDNPQGDLNAVPEMLRDRVDRDTFISDWHRQEVIAGLPVPIVVSPSLLFVGSEELLHQRAAHDLLCNFWPVVDGVTIDGAGHDVLDDKYLDSIASNASKLVDMERPEKSRRELLNDISRKIVARAYLEEVSISGPPDRQHTPFADFQEEFLRTNILGQ